MINKRSLWLLTLFSLILVLSVYYITMPSELLIATNNGSKKEETKVVSKTDDGESAELVALRATEEEKILDKITELKKILTDSNASTDEKNKAFEELQKINKNKSLEEDIEKQIKKEFNLKSFVGISDNNVSIFVSSSKHDSRLANKIMRSVQSNFDIPMKISVKFGK